MSCFCRSGHKLLRRYTSVRNNLLKAVCLKCTSLAIHSNVIEELQNNSPITNSEITITMHNCIISLVKINIPVIQLVPGF